MTLSARQAIQLTLLATAVGLSGCKSAQQKANDAAIAEAKQTAAQTGAAQQVVTTDKDGTMTTTVVQPAAPGQTTQQITTSTTKTSTTTASAPRVSPLQPAVAATSTPSDTLSAPAPPSDSVPATSATSGVTQPVIAPVDVHVARGTALAIRINQRISVKTSRAGERFSGEVARAVSVNDREVIPRGTPVEGVIAESHRRGHFKGRSILELRLISMRLNGTRYGLDTRNNVTTKKGKGKRSTAFIGGGTGLGMLVGGVATGGVGLVVGGLVGAGGGTLLGGLTGNRDLVIPAESVVNFRLADDLVVQPL